MYWLIIILVVVVASTLLFWASANIGSNVYLKSICCAKTQRRVVALTFDDAPNAQTTPQVLDVLKQYNVKAMFCLIGQEAERNPELVRRIIDEGHIVANHTYTIAPALRLPPRRVSQSSCSDAMMPSMLLLDESLVSSDLLLESPTPSLVRSCVR